MDFWNSPLGTRFPLGTDTAWTIIALGLVSVFALAVPFTLFKSTPAHGARGRAIGGRLAALVSEASRGAMWAGALLAVAVFAVPAEGIERLIPAALIAVGVVLGIAIAWRSISLVSRILADSSQTRLAHAHRVAPLTASTGAAAASLVCAVLVGVYKHQAGHLMIVFALGLAVMGVAIRAVQALAQIGAAAATFGVGALEHDHAPGSEDDPGVGMGGVSRLLAHGPLRALDAAAVAVLIPGVVMLLGVPLFGTAAVLTALVLALALNAALLLPLVLPFAGSGAEVSERRMRSLGASLAGVIPAIGALAALALWIPSEYAKLRMKQVGLGDFTDTDLISQFVDPAMVQQGQVPTSVDRDVLEPYIAQVAAKPSALLERFSDSPNAQSVVDTIILHTLNPAQMTAIAIAVGTVCALAVAGLVAYISRGFSGVRRRHTRSASTSPAAVELSGLALGVPGALVAVLLLAGVWLLVTVSAGIAYLAFYSLALAGAATVIVGAGYLSIAGIDTAGAARCVEEDEPEEKNNVRQESVGSVAAGEDSVDDDEHEESRVKAAAVAAIAPSAQVLTRLLMPLGATSMVLALIGPLGGEMRAAKELTQLWNDRSLRVLYLDSPTVVFGVVLGVIAVCAAAALVADPMRRVLASVTTDTRAVFAVDSDDHARAQHRGLGSQSRRVGAVALIIAVMGPLASGFGLGAASLPGYVVGAVVVGTLMTVTAAMRGEAARQSLVGVEMRPEGSGGGRGSLAHLHALSAVYSEHLRAAVSGLAGATGLGSFTLMSALAAYVVAPLVVQFATDGTNPWIRAVAVVAAILLIAGVAVLARDIEEPALDGDEDDSEPLFEIDERN